MTAPIVPRKRGLLEKIFAPQGANAPEGLVPADLLHQIGNRSLLAAGLGLMQASHTRGANRNWGASLGAALQAGQESYSGGLESAEQQGILNQKQSEMERIDTLRKTVAAKYPAVEGETPKQKVIRLTNMAMEYAQGGDHQTASNLVSTANALRSAGASQYQYVQKNGIITQINKETGETRRLTNPDEITQARLELSQGNLDARNAELGLSGQRLMQRQGLAFYTRNRKVIDWGHALNQAITTISDAKGNKYLTSSTIANFVQAADQNARLQIQMLNYFKTDIDPSFVGRWENWKDRALTGQYKPEVYEKLLGHLKKLRKLAGKEYDSQRNAEIRKHPKASDWILESDDALSQAEEDAADGSGAAPAGGQASKLDSF